MRCGNGLYRNRTAQISCAEQTSKKSLDRGIAVYNSGVGSQSRGDVGQPLEHLHCGQESAWRPLIRPGATGRSHASTCILQFENGKGVARADWR